MAGYKIFKDMGTKFIIDNGADLIYDSAKEASNDNKSFIRTLGDNITNKAISDIASGLFGKEATLVYQAASKVMEGIDKTFEYGREKARNEADSGVISVGQLGNGFFKTSGAAATIRQRQLQNMNSDMQSARAMFGSEARKRAMNISY